MSGPLPPDEPQGTAAPAAEEDLAVAILLGAAATADAADVARIRAAVRAAWRERLAADRRRRRLLVAGALAAAAAVAIAVALVLPASRPASLAPPAATAAVAGAVERVIPVALDAHADAVFTRGGQPLAAGAAVRVGDALATSRETLAALRLGSASVRLDAGTRLTVTGPRRLRLDAGALYVDSPPAADGGSPPVEIATPHGAARELGTRFEVRVDGERTRVRVREGAVQWRRSGEATQRLGVAQQLEAAAEGGVTVRAAPVSGGDWDWVARAAPTPPLEGARLGDLLDWVGRETGAEVVFVPAASAEAARAIVLHGPLEDLDPVEAVELVLPACGLRGHFTGGRLVVEAPEP